MILQDTRLSLIYEAREKYPTGREVRIYKGKTVRVGSGEFSFKFGTLIRYDYPNYGQVRGFVTLWTAKKGWIEIVKN